MCESNCCESEDKFKVGDRVVSSYTEVCELGNPDVVGVVKGKDTIYIVDFPYGEERYDAEGLVAMPIFEAPKDEPNEDEANLRKAIKICRIARMPNDAIADVLLTNLEEHPEMKAVVLALREELGLPETGVPYEKIEEALLPEIEGLFAEIFGEDIFKNPDPVF